MKSLYQCEKCKKLFEDYSSACSCEESHYSPESICNWSTDEETVKKLLDSQEYSDSSLYPTKLAIMLYHSDYNTEKETWIKKRVIGYYKLTKTEEVEEQEG